MVDYFETESYIFTHGWIPCWCIKNDSSTTYIPFDEWRTAPKPMWTGARWRNDMEAAHHGIIEPGKTIVCGHWNCSFGYSHYENDGGEFDNKPNFEPCYGKGIIALDACTPISGKVNCVVIEGGAAKKLLTDEQCEKQMGERLWLDYFNRYLFEHRANARKNVREGMRFLDNVPVSMIPNFYAQTMHNHPKVFCE